MTTNNRPLTGGFGGNPALKVGQPVKFSSQTEEMEVVEEPVKVRNRKKRAVPFHETYNQFTSYIHADYEPVLERLWQEFEESKTALVNEALYDLFCKHSEALKAIGIDVASLPPHPAPSKRKR